MNNKDELNAIARHHPETFDKVRDAERAVGEVKNTDESTFWAADTTAQKYRSHKTTSKDGSVHYVPNAYDVRDWALGRQPLHEDQLLLFADFDETFNVDSPVCESAYGLCEVAMAEGVSFNEPG